MDKSTETNVKFAKMKDFIRDFYETNWASRSGDEIYNMMVNVCNVFLNESPFTVNETEQTAFYIGNFNDNNIKASANSNGIINVSYNFLYNVITKKRPLVEAIYVLAHEKRHIAQYNALDYLNKNGFNEKSSQKENAIKIISEINEKEINKEAVPFIIGILENQLGENFNKFVNLSNEDKEKICEDFVFDQYFNFQHELDARLTGYEFAKHITLKLLEDETLDKHIKDNLVKEFKMVESIEKKERAQNKNPFREKIDNAIKNTSVEELINEFKRISSIVDRWIPIASKDDNFQEVSNKKQNINAQLNSAIEYISNQKYKDCSVDELINYAYTSCLAGYKQGLNTIVNNLKLKTEFTKEKSFDLKNGIIDVLQNSNNLHLDSYKIDYSNIIGLDGVACVLNNLLNQKKYAVAMQIGENCILDNLSSYVGNLQNKERKQLDKICDLMVKTKETYIKDSNNNDKISSIEKNTVMLSYIPEEYLIKNKVRLKPIITNELMDEQEEMVHLNLNYGEMVACDLIEKDKHSEFKLMTDAFKSQPEGTSQKVGEDRLLN